MKRQPKITQREIQRQLALLREEVAAPRDFRAKVLARISAGAGQAWPAPKMTLRQRLMHWMATPSLVAGLAASLALAFGLSLALLRIQAPPAPFAVAPLPAVSAVQAPQAAPKLAQAHPLASKHPRSIVAKAPGAGAAAQVSVAHVAAPIILPEVHGSAAQAPAAAGSAAIGQPASQPVFSGTSAAAPSAAPSFGGAGMAASSGPSASGGVNPGTTPTPPFQELQGSSQVRRNKFLPGRGEYAAILFRLKEPGHVHIQAYDRNGRIIAQIHDGDHGAGVFEIDWYGHEDDGSVAPTGIYLLRISTGEYDDRHKVVVLR